MTQERGLNETPSAPTKKPEPILPQRARPHFATRLQWRRKITRELDEFFGIFHYPDVAKLYAVPPSREPE